MEDKIDLVWTGVMIQELLAHGVSYFCLSPGSRSTPLVLGLSNNPAAEVFVHFDERAMAFHALGFAKASKKPVAIIVTSATAAGNLLPAIMEAHESAIPLLILTADRPPELQECGANQTTDQTHMFQNYVRWQCMLPPPSSAISVDYLKTTLAHAIAKATTCHKGPVHLNCSFREPFSLHLTSKTAIPSFPKTELLPSTALLEKGALNLLSILLNHSKKGIILLGYEALQDEDMESFYTLAKALQWPILCDVLSKGRDHPCSIAHYDLMWEAIHADIDHTFYPDCVLHFGGAFVSKHLMTFLKKAAPATYIHCLSYTKRQDPMHLVTHRITMPIRALCAQLALELTSRDASSKTSSYLMQWQQLDCSIQCSIEQIFSEKQPLNEPQLSYTLAHYNLSDYALFLASSMPIRTTTQFFHPATMPQQIYGNRGLSGIDGNIATTIGIAKARSIPMIALLGDQTFLHDLTSLSQLKSLLHPIIFLIINNDGGAIFSFLPIYERKEICEIYFVNPHHLTFSSAAKLFNLPYYHCSSIEEFQTSFTQALSSSKHHLIEIKTDLENNLKIHRMVKQRVLENAEHILLRR